MAEITETERERRRKIGEANRGNKRPDLAARNKTAAMRNIPRRISDEGRQRLSELKTEHGHGRDRKTGRGATPTYNSWAHMIQRCTNPNNQDWKYYGARGIKVCDRWRDFANFLEDMGEKPEGLTLDRIDVDGDYEPSNVRWASPSQQSSNRRPQAWEGRQRDARGRYV